MQCNAVPLSDLIYGGFTGSLHTLQAHRAGFLHGRHFLQHAAKHVVGRHSCHKCLS
jgi:hypothetical protein